jgi:hypothetical protein
MDEISCVRLDDGTDSGEYFTTSSLYLTIVRSYCSFGLRGSFILPLIYVMCKLDINIGIRFGNFKNLFQMVDHLVQF